MTNFDECLLFQKCQSSRSKLLSEMVGANDEKRQKLQEEVENVNAETTRLQEQHQNLKGKRINHVEIMLELTDQKGPIISLDMLCLKGGRWEIMKAFTFRCSCKIHPHASCKHMGMNERVCNLTLAY